MPVSFIIAHELDKELKDGNNYLEFTNNFYQTFGSLFISCDNKIDPKEKNVFIKYCDTLEKNVKKLRSGRYKFDIDYNELKQTKCNSIKKQSNFCTNCGFENRPNVKFCTKCGNKMI